MRTDSAFPRLLNKILLFAVLTSPTLVVAAPATFIYQGQIIKSNGQPLSGNPTTFTVQIVSPGTEACVLYEEKHILNMSSSEGVFSLSVGNGIRSGTFYENTSNIVTVFKNTSVFSGLAHCTNGDTSYGPSSLNDRRKLRLTYNDGTGDVLLASDHNIQSVPFAWDAKTIDGLAPSNFVQVSVVDNLTQDKMQTLFTGSNYTTLLGLADGSTQVVTSGVNGAAIPSFTTDPVSPPAGSMWVNTTTNEMKYNSGSGIEVVGAGGGSGDITGVTTNSGSGLSGGAASGTPVLQVVVDNSTVEIATNTIRVKDAGITAAKILDGSVTDAKITGVAVDKITSASGKYFSYMPDATECADNGILRWDATNDRWFCGTETVSAGDISSVVAGTGLTGGATSGAATLNVDVGTGPAQFQTNDAIGHCTANQKLEMSAGPVYTWSCVNEYTPANLADIDGNTKIQVEESANEDKIRFDTAGSERMIIDNTGRVGVGLTNPSHLMHIDTTVTDPPSYSMASIRANMSTSYSMDSSNGSWGLNASVRPTVSMGKTLNGSAVGVLGAGFVQSSSHAGTINKLIGLESDYGVSVAGATGTVTSAIGVYVVPYNRSGTINNSYGVYIDNPALSGATVGNSYGVYQTNVSALNYFAGNLGLGTATPGSPLDVVGTIRTDSICDRTGSNCKTISDGWDAGGDITGVLTDSGSGLSGGSASGTPDLQVVVDNSTVEIATNTVQLKDGGVVTAKLADGSVTNVKIASMAVDKITSASEKYFSYMPNASECADSGVLKWDATNDRWMCGTDLDTNTDAVSSVLGRTGAVVAVAGDYTATQITNTATGNIAATTAQAAINELDSEKVSKAGDTMTGVLTMTNSVVMNAQNEVRLGDSDSSNYAAIRAPATVATDYVLTLPGTDGNSGEVLTTDGSGVLSWSAVGGGDISSVVAGTGLTGGATSGEATLNVDVGTGPAQFQTNDAIGHCTANQKLEMSAGPVYTWSCVNEYTPATLADIDGNTKIQVEESENDDKIRFDTAGSERMSINATGKVGIGVTSPVALMDIRGPSSTPATSGATNNGLLRLVNTSSNVSMDFGSLNAAPWSAWIQTAEYQELGNIQALALNPNGGFVGIGTLDPTGPLSIRSKSSTPASIIQNWVSSSGQNLEVLQPNPGDPESPFILRTDSSFRFQVDSTEALSMGATGRIGIGVSTPTAKLDVRAPASAPATSGTTNNGIFRLVNTSSNVSLDMGSLDTAPWSAWIQTGEYGELGTRHPLALNPNGGNVGIGTTEPAEQLEVAGTVKATKFESTSAARIRVLLNHCGGACASYHTLNTWTDIGGSGYGHTSSTTDTTTFTSSAQGTTTVNKAGTYMIRIFMMQINTNTEGYGRYAAPIINGSPNYLGASSVDTVPHFYATAGAWHSTVHTFVGELTVGTTVSYGYHPSNTLNYWAHDGFTGYEIIKIN